MINEVYQQMEIQSINYIINKEPFNLGVFNFNNNMISINYNSAYSEETVKEYL